jgi:hypothetical protein
MEITYTFHRSTSGQGEPEVITVKESELNSQQMDLLAGTFINELSKLPIKVQHIILNNLLK